MNDMKKLSSDVEQSHTASEVSTQKTRVQMRKRTFLTALAASTFSTNTFGFGFNFMSIFRDDYEQIFEFSTEKDVYREPTDLAKTRDGGYLCVANEPVGHSVLLKIDARGKQQWTRPVAPSERGATQDFYSLAVSQSGHGYLAVGKSNSYDLVGHGWDENKNHGVNLPGRPDSAPLAAMAMKLNDDGSIAWQKAFGPLEKDALHSFQRCIAIADGYIVVGNQRLPSGEPYGCFPWIVKLSEQGKVEWDVVIKSHNGKLINFQTIFGGDEIIKPLVNADGSIVMAFCFQYSGNGQASGGGANRHTLILKLDTTGKEIARYEATEGLATVLFPSGDGFEVLIQKFTLSNFVGFHRLKFNSSLKLIASHYIEEGEFAPLCAVQGPGQSMHVAGVSIKGGTEFPEVTLGLMQPNGKIEHRKFFGRVSTHANIVSGDRNDEVVLAYQASGNITRIAKLRLRN